MRANTSTPTRPPFPALHAYATVICDATQKLPNLQLRISYYYYEELFERIFLIQRDRNFADTRITVTLHHGREFEWNRERALQCFIRRQPDPRRLLDTLPSVV